MNKVNINLLTFNGLKYLPYCLTSIFNQSYKDFELLIIDNASTDGSINWIKKYYPQIKILQNKENLGFCRAHNIAIKQTTGDYLLLLNQDIFLEIKYLAKVVEILDTKPQAAAVQGKILRWNFPSKITKCNNLTKNSKFDTIDSAGLLALPYCRFVERGQNTQDQGQFNQLEEIFGVTGALPLYRRKALRAVKINEQYFPETFFYLKEDIDLAWRLKAAGWQAWYQPQAIAYHDRTVAIKIGTYQTKNIAIIKNRKQKSKLARWHSFKNQQLLLIRNLRLNNYLRHFFPITWYQFKQFIYIVLFEQFLLSSVWQIIKLLPQTLKERKQVLRLQRISNKQLNNCFKN